MRTVKRKGLVPNSGQTWSEKEEQKTLRGPLKAINMFHTWMEACHKKQRQWVEQAKGTLKRKSSYTWTSLWAKPAVDSPKETIRKRKRPHTKCLNKKHGLKEQGAWGGPAEAWKPCSILNEKHGCQTKGDEQAETSEASKPRSILEQTWITKRHRCCGSILWCMTRIVLFCVCVFSVYHPV
jgi:hypothetical protein